MIRLARKEDLAAIRALAVESILHSLPTTREATPEQVQQAMLDSLADLEETLGRDRNTLLLVETTKDHRLKGYILVQLNHVEPATGERQGFIVDIAVTPEFRGGMTVKRLIEKASQLVAARGLKYLVGTISANNQAALRVQKALGFEIERHQIVRRCRLPGQT
ncbi:MAG: N-acetyltransferase family protein [Vulcanimicrobiota bacterium]